MINYIQQLLPRIRQYNSRLDKKELFVDKLFTVLQPNNEVHQYTFNRDGRLFLAINGLTTEGKWELLATGQLLINRGKNDIITLDFEFLHPDVLIMKLGGTITNPFIIYRNDIIKDGNILNFLKKFEAKSKGEKIYELPNQIICESELKDLIMDEYGIPYSGELTSSEEDLGYTLSVKHIYVVEKGVIKSQHYEVTYPYELNDDILVVKQIDKFGINISDSVIPTKSSSNFVKPNSQVKLANQVLQLNDKYEVISIKSDTVGNILVPIIGILFLILMVLLLLDFNFSTSSKTSDSSLIDSVEVTQQDSFDSVDTIRAAADSMPR